MNNDNNDYVFRPRGIEKWHAFAALLSGDEQKQSAIDEEILSFSFFDDYLDEMNHTLNEAFTLKKKIIIHYLKDNVYQQEIGIVKKIDDFNRQLILENNFKIALKTIYSVEIL